MSAQPRFAAWKNRLRLLGSLVSLALFIWLIARQDWNSVLGAIQASPWWTVPAALILYLVGQGFNALRWFFLLKAQEVPLTYPAAARILFAGAFASNFLPSTVGGDAFRVVSLFPYTPNKVMALASIILDRVINMSAFLTILPLGIIFWFQTQGAGLALAGALAFLPNWLTKLLRRSLDELTSAYRLWAGRPAALLRAFVASWFSDFVVFVGLWIQSRGLGIEISLWQVMGITALTYFLTLLPISINGYGVREIIVTTFYMRAGASLEQASALALISRFLLVTATLPGALFLPRVGAKE